MGDPVEFPGEPATPNGELFLGIFFIEAAGVDPTLPADPVENVPLVSNGGRIRLRNLAVAGNYTVQTPVGNFVFIAAADNQGRVRDIDELLPTTVDAAAPFTGALGPSAPIQRFRGNGTGDVALDPIPAIPPDPAVPGFTPPTAGPGFIGNGVTLAPLTGGGVFRVIGPAGSGIDVSTSNFSVEGKIFTTPEALAGGLVVERGTMIGGARANGVLFAQTNVLGGTMEITSIAGVTQPTPIAMTADPAIPGRFFAPFAMGNLTGEPTVGMSVTVRDAAGAVAPGLEELPIVLQDTVAVRSATFNAGRAGQPGRLTVSASSSVPGSATVRGAVLSVQSVDALGNVLAELGTITGRSFAVPVASPPALVRVNSSLGGSMTVPVRVRGVPATEVITVRSATFTRGRGALAITASSSVRGNPLTVQGVDHAGNPVGPPLGQIVGRGLRAANVVVPPAFVRVSSTGASTTIPVTIR